MENDDSARAIPSVRSDLSGLEEGGVESFQRGKSCPLFSTARILVEMEYKR